MTEEERARILSDPAMQRAVTRARWAGRIAYIGVMVAAVLLIRFAGVWVGAAVILTTYLFAKYVLKAPL